MKNITNVGIIEDDLSVIKSVEGFIKAVYPDINLTSIYYLNSSIQEITKEIKLKNIEVLFVDGLNGDWKKIYDVVKRENPNTKFVLVSADINYVEEAKKQGIASYEKDYFEVLKKEIQNS